MKKIITLILLMLVSAMPAAFADYMCEVTQPATALFPETLYSPTPAVSTAIKRAPRALSEKQRLMNYLCEQLKNSPAEVDVSEFKIAAKKFSPSGAAITYEDFFDILISAVWATPEVGNLLTGHNGYSRSYSGYIIAFRPMYMTVPYDSEEFETQIKYILSRVVSPEMDDTQKLLALHDYLADTCIYNKAAADKGEIIPSDEDSFAFTAYGAIVKKTCVCQGYSFALKLLCDRLGIDCGYARNSGHSWNVARAADGNLYHIDITFDDPIFSSPLGGYEYENDGKSKLQTVYHNNFLTNDESIFAAHSTDKYTETSDTVRTSYDTDTEKLRITDGLASGFDWYKRHGVIFWQDGEFWQLCRGEGNSFYGDSKTNLYSYKPLRYTSSGVVTVPAEEFPTMRRLSAQIFNLNDGYVALRGTPGTAATLYEVERSGSSFRSAKSTRVTFDECGRAFADVQNINSKLILISDGFLPAAYPRSNNITLWQ